MKTRRLVAMFMLAAVSCAVASENLVRIAVVQTVNEVGVDANRAKIVRFIRQAGEAGCHLAVFNENALLENTPEAVARQPKKAELDRAIDDIRSAAKASGVAVVLGTAYKKADGDPLLNRAYVFGPDGGLLLSYWKNSEVPRTFDIHGVRCAVTICSDRGYLEHSDLACVTQGAQVIVDISGGHGGDDGRPGLRWIRYRPWAIRNEAYVIVSNPVHDEMDFMGNSPYGGGSAVIRPNGSLQASRIYEKDVMMVADLDLAAATRREAERRRQHPLFREFWDWGERLFKREAVASGPQIAPYQSTARDIKIAAAQVAGAANLEETKSKVLEFINRAAGEKADIVVFPALTLTGDRPDAVLGATQAAMDSALNAIQRQAKSAGIYVIIGLPYFVDGERHNCAFVIGDDGAIKTRYAEIAGRENSLFRGGDATKTMWFNLKGVQSIVTVGADANWVEIGDLAANRGMVLHFHITNEADGSAEDALVRKQRNVLALSYAHFGAVVNAADGSSPSGFPARGGSMIVSREGGHERAAPKGLEHYLPYQTSIVCSAGPAETILYATRRTGTRNSLDADRYWRNRQRKSRPEAGWHDWIKVGAAAIGGSTEK